MLRGKARDVIGHASQSARGTLTLSTSHDRASPVLAPCWPCAGPVLALRWPHWPCVGPLLCNAMHLNCRLIAIQLTAMLNDDNAPALKRSHIKGLLCGTPQ